jgi:hypothetical protein
MLVPKIQAEDILDKARTWSLWNSMIILSLEEHELWDTVHSPIVVPLVTAPVLVEEFRKRNNKGKMTIFDEVRDHIVPHLTSKYYAFRMWESLCKLYHSQNKNQKMVMREKIRSIQMLNFESFT